MTCTKGLGRPIVFLYAQEKIIIIIIIIIIIKGKLRGKGEGRGEGRKEPKYIYLYILDSINNPESFVSGAGGVHNLVISSVRGSCAAAGGSSSPAAVGAAGAAGVPLAAAARTLVLGSLWSFFHFMRRF